MNNNFSTSVMKGTHPPNDEWIDGDVYHQMITKKKYEIHGMMIP